MPWPQPPAPGVFCGTPYHAAMREERLPRKPFIERDAQ